MGFGWVGLCVLTHAWLTVFRNDCARSEDFADQWKAWIKAVGKATKKKGKGLFHPIRLALTGRMSGPDVGEQVGLISGCRCWSV